MHSASFIASSGWLLPFLLLSTGAMIPSTAATTTAVLSATHRSTVLMRLCPPSSSTVHRRRLRPALASASVSAASLVTAAAAVASTQPVSAAAFSAHRPKLPVSGLPPSPIGASSTVHRSGISKDHWATRPYSTSPMAQVSSSTFLHAAATSSSDFVPPPPPSSKGMAMFPDIDLSVSSPTSNSSSSSTEAARRNSDPHAVFVVTGANRGIGLQFVRSLLKRTNGTIVACCRNPATATELTELQKGLQSHNREESESGESEERGRVVLQQLDVGDQSSIDSAAEVIQKRFGRVDMLLNVAGVLGDGTNTPGPERSLKQMDRDWLEKTLAVNAVGPVMVTKALMPLMQTRRRRVAAQKKGGSKAGEEKKEQQEERAKAIIANLSARVGSISDNDLGGWYSYRMSKAALNQATRTVAHEGKRHNVWCVALHPGTTDTDLSKPFQKNVAEGRLFPVEFTVGQLLDCLEGLDDRHSGGFYDWSGKALPF